MNILIYSNLKYLKYFEKNFGEKIKKIRKKNPINNSIKIWIKFEKISIKNLKKILIEFPKNQIKNSKKF